MCLLAAWQAAILTFLDAASDIMKFCISSLTFHSWTQYLYGTSAIAAVQIVEDESLHPAWGGGGGVGGGVGGGGGGWGVGGGWGWGDAITHPESALYLEMLSAKCPPFWSVGNVLRLIDNPSICFLRLMPPATCNPINAGSSGTAKLAILSGCLQDNWH